MGHYIVLVFVVSVTTNDVTVFVGTKNINEEFKINFGLKAKMPKKSFGKKL